MAWDKNELVALGMIVLSVSALTLVGKISEASYMSVISALVGYTFGRIFNQKQRKE